MLIKGTFVSQPSGSLGGITASHNRSGYYLRSRIVPVNPNTVQQQAVRNLAGTLASAWVNTLTDVQRAAWDVYGSNVAMTNRVGDTIYLTGLNHFIRCNVPRMQALLPMVEDAPTIFSLADMTLPAIAVSEATQECTLAYTNTDAWAVDDDGFMALSLSRPMNPSINYFKGPYRYSGVVYGNTATPPTSPELIDVPFPVVEDQRVFGFVRVGLPDGRLSTPVRLHHDVQA